MFKKLVILLILLFNTTAQSAPAFYRGKINMVWTDAQDGGFVVTFSENSSLSDCKHQYAYFRSVNMQPELLKNALSLALSAFHSESNVGIVIDKELNGEYCYAMSISVNKE